MKKALGCILSAAFFAGISASVPAFAEDFPDEEISGPFPAVVIDASMLREEAFAPTVPVPGTMLSQNDGSAGLISSEAPLSETPSRTEGNYNKGAAETPAEEAAPAAENADKEVTAPAGKIEPSEEKLVHPLENSEEPAESTEDAKEAGTSADTSSDDNASDKADAEASVPAASAEDGTQADKEVTDKSSDSAKDERKASAIPNTLVFSGEVEDKGPDTLRVKGVDANGEPTSLDFFIDSSSQVAEGIKPGDTVSVYYEVAESGGYRVTSARYASGDLPANVFPGDIPEVAGSKTDSEILSEAGEKLKDADDVPHIVSIEVEGNKTVSTEEVLQVISSRIGDPLLDPRIRRDMQAIYDSGYYTDVRLDTRYAPGGVRLVFRVLENPTVDEIDISGNNIVDTEKIRSLMKTEPGRILNTRTLQSDIAEINKYYNEELGYTITPSHVTKLDFSEGKLSLVLVDGIEVKEVEVTGVTVFPTEKVKALVQTKPGDLFNRNTLREDTERISKLYDDSQYILDTIKPSVDAETGKVTLTVVEAVLQEIRVAGNTRTKTETVLRNIRSKPGEVMRRDKLQRDMERLNNLGFFKKVEPEVEPGSEPGNAILVLNVEEQKTGMATVGVGYAGGGSGAVRPGITGAISFSERNLFGEGKSISVNLQRGSQIGSYGISYYDPAINEAQDSIGISAYYNSVDELQQSVSGQPYGTYAYYDQKVYGGTFTFGHPFTDDLRGFITLRHETLDLKRSSKSEYEPIGMGKGDLNSIALSVLYDTRDDVFNPHNGSYVNASFSYAGEFLGGDYDYTKLLGEVRHYIPVTERSTLAMRGLYGSVGNGAPASEYFYAGGTDTLRGYNDNAFFGTKVILLNAEYRFPLGGIKMLNGAVFVDAGNAWITGRTSSKLYTDAGIGLRIVFPNLGLGVIRIDYAFGQDGSRSSIGIGQSF